MFTLEIVHLYLYLTDGNGIMVILRTNSQYSHWCVSGGTKQEREINQSNGKRRINWVCVTALMRLEGSGMGQGESRTQLIMYQFN